MRTERGLAWLHARQNGKRLKGRFYWDGLSSEAENRPSAADRPHLCSPYLGTGKGEVMAKKRASLRLPVKHRKQQDAERRPSGRSDSANIASKPAMACSASGSGIIW